MDYKIITAIPKTAEEITGIKGCKEFYGEDERGKYEYVPSMNAFVLDLKNKRIKFEKTDNPHYDYENRGNGISWLWRKEWLKDIREEVDWGKVPVDTRIIVSNCRDFKIVQKRYFAKYEDGKIYAWYGGATSWSAKSNLVTGWKYAKLADDNVSESNEN